ncbi:hypothetical protein [Moraxella sp. ZY210820]|uniref:hypothetical protein n=1 Tax=unclassified Moraxella TaxID=2685852 RepID=UPI00273157BE|nr:hypothetical protein [Moraxella sp. ZY210820]WLF84926.1 hypothetical protein LU301_05535 [Moraxella sp. ZY210820]
MQKLAFKPIENHQLAKILDEYRQSRHLFRSIYRVIVLILSLIFAILCLNLLVGVVLYVLALSSSILWHSVSVLVIGLYLTAFSCGLLYQYYRVAYTSKTLFNDTVAHKISMNHQPLQEQELLLYQLNQHIAQQFSIEEIDVFTLDEESIHSFSFHLEPNVPYILVTRGLLSHFSPQDIYQILVAQYISILSGETRTRSHYFIYLQGYFLTAYYANKLIFKAEYQLKQSSPRLKYRMQFCLGWLLKILSSFDAWLYQRIQCYLFHQDFSLDGCIAQYHHHTICMLQRMQLYPDLLSIQRMDLVYLSPLALFQSYHLWQCSPYQHIQHRLDALRYLSLEMKMQDVKHYILAQRHHQASNIQAMYQQSHFLKQRLFKFDYQKNKLYWSHTNVMTVMSKQFNPQNRHIDQIRPLNPEIRTQQAQIYLQQIFPTKAHYLHVLSYIFELRKVHRPSLVQTKDISAAVTMVLYKADQRLLVEIFEQCCDLLTIPTIVAKPYILAWSKTIQSDGEIHLLDALMFERVKAKWQWSCPSQPQTLAGVMGSVAQLVEAVSYVQPFVIPSKVYETAYYETFGELYPPYRKQAMDYHCIFQELSGLTVADKLKVLTLIEQLLWHHQKITQDAFDVIVLLYWRLGFDKEPIQKMLYKRSQIAIW